MRSICLSMCFVVASLQAALPQTEATVSHVNRYSPKSQIHRLNLGLDALVFVDDNPAERALIRQELPEVAVPEMPEDPAGFVRCLARAGYFEAVCCTADDLKRAEQYRANAERAAVRERATDMHSYLAGLDMHAYWSAFDENGLARIVQLINKTNQFNLTTPRVSEAEVRAWIADPCMKTWQVRLTDRFGDNGVVALMARRRENGFGIDFQAKASVCWMIDGSHVVFDLEAKTYNDLVSRSAAATRFIVVLLCLPRTIPEWHEVGHNETVLRNGCYWLSIAGCQTTNQHKKRVRFPLANLLTAVSLQQIIADDRAAREAIYA